MSEANHKRLNEMILQGKALEGFEEFYADGTVMCENFDVECVGKDANRKREKEFFASIEKFNGATLGKTAYQGDVGFTEMAFDVVFKGGKHTVMQEVSVREWRNGKIVHERFYYKGM